MVLSVDTDTLVFTQDGNRMWIATTDKGKISVNVLADVTKIFHAREEKFEDLYEALDYLRKLTGKNVLFEMGTETANTQTKF